MTTLDYTPIPIAKLPEMVGKAVHVKWAKFKGMVWILDRIEGDKLILRPPKTNKMLVTNIRNACYTRKHEPKK